jgi:hypothetical protein
MVDKLEIKQLYFPHSSSLRVTNVKDKNSQNNQQEFNRQFKEKSDSEDKEKENQSPHCILELHETGIHGEVSDSGE